MEIATISLCGGVKMPVLGQGTWYMGRSRAQRRAEVAALSLGIELGMVLIDTAEMYDDAESVVGEVIRGRRDAVFLVSKVLPGNASRVGTMRAAERSLKKLGTDYLDLYLLHWEGPHPLAETLAAFLELKEQGKIRAFGVSNFDINTLAHAQLTTGGDLIAANQILYNPARRGPEHRLIPACQAQGIAIMAYSPLDHARLDMDALAEVAQRHDATPAQIAIAWTLRMEGMVSIPKAVDHAHIRANAAAAAIELSAQDLADIDRAFPLAPDDALEFL